MSSRPTRRKFLNTSAAGALLGLGDLSAFLPFSPARAADAKVTPEMVRFSADIEPLVRLIEETPRDKCFEVIAGKLRQGLPYRQFLAALFLAGIRDVKPQPVGFKLHCVFVIHSAHQLSLDARPEERLLPLFFALDNFKKSQEEEAKLGDYRLAPVEGRLPAPEKAWDEFHAAMEAWDAPRADRAIAVLSRTRGAHEVAEGLWRYGARDYRNIGHKAIFVANSWRTLQTIGWQHAEPTLRSLTLGLLDFGKQRQVNGFAYEDQSYLPNLDRAGKAAAKLPGDWAAPGGDKAVTEDLLKVLRDGKTDDACRSAVATLVGGKARADSVWDAVHLAGGELMLRQPGIPGLHAVTSVNALHYAFRMSASAETRLLLLLQGIGWVGQFRQFMGFGKTPLKDVRITDLPVGEVARKPQEAMEELLAMASRSKPVETAAKALRLAQAHPETEPLLQAARRLVITKASEVHDYKYPVAAFEDLALVSPAWRPHMLATAFCYLHGSGEPDSAVMQRARAAVEAK